MESLIPTRFTGPQRIVCLTEETTEWLYLLGEERRIVGISGYKNFRSLFRALRRGQTEARQIIAVHVVMLGASLIMMRPMAYVVWIVSWATLWRVSNRLRAIAEHGGMTRSKDRRCGR